MKRIVAVGVAVAFGAMASTASAEVRKGSITDPAGDASLGLDITNVGVTYDSAAGRLTARVEVNPATNATDFGGDFTVAVGATAPGGTCRANQPGDAVAASTLVWDFTAADLNLVGVADPVASISGPDSGVSESFPAYTYTFESPQLVGHDYRCVMPLSFDAIAGAADNVNGFVLSAPAPPQAAPTTTTTTTTTTPAPVSTGSVLGESAVQTALRVRTTRRLGLRTARKRGVVVRLTRRATVQLIQRGRVIAKRTGTGRLVLHPKRLRAGKATLRISDGAAVVTRRIRIVR